MPRQQILTPAEQQSFDNPPVLSAVERRKYFFISPALDELLASLRPPTNQVCFLVQLGYFRATHRFFSPPYPLPDVAYVARPREILPDAVEMSSGIFQQRYGNSHRIGPAQLAPDSTPHYPRMGR